MEGRIFWPVWVSKIQVITLRQVDTIHWMYRDKHLRMLTSLNSRNTCSSSIRINLTSSSTITHKISFSSSNSSIKILINSKARIKVATFLLKFLTFNTSRIKPQAATMAKIRICSTIPTCSKTSKTNRIKVKLTSKIKACKTSNSIIDKGIRPQRQLPQWFLVSRGREVRMDLRYSKWTSIKWCQTTTWSTYRPFKIQRSCKMAWVLKVSHLSLYIKDKTLIQGNRTILAWFSERILLKGLNRDRINNKITTLLGLEPVLCMLTIKGNCRLVQLRMRNFHLTCKARINRQELLC